MDGIYNSFGIYRITNTITGQSYIGKTTLNFGDRWDSHRALLRAHKHFNSRLQESWIKFGEDAFEFDAVEILQDSSTIDKLEQKHICDCRLKGLSFNVQSGGQCGFSTQPMSSETKAKIGAKNRVRMLGRKASEETRRKMSEAHKRRYAGWSVEDRQAHGCKSSVYARGYKWSDEAKSKFAARQHEKPNGAKFTKEQVLEIRERSANGENRASLAAEFGTTASYITMIVQRKRWAHI